MRIGAVPVPVNPMDRVDNHVYYLEDSYARVLVIEASLLPSARGDARRAARGCTWSWWRRARAAYTSFDYIVADGDEPAGAGGHARDDMAFWLYSSGSTGKPKGVVHLHHDIG